MQDVHTHTLLDLNICVCSFFHCLALPLGAIHGFCQSLFISGTQILKLELSGLGELSSKSTRESPVFPDDLIHLARRYRWLAPCWLLPVSPAPLSVFYCYILYGERDPLLHQTIACQGLK